VHYATVEVYFQEILDDEREPDAYEIVEKSQFRVARRVDRQSHSKYILNGYDSTFKEVCDLL
jgi:chromosome segregation ATPase